MHYSVKFMSENSASNYFSDCQTRGKKNGKIIINKKDVAHLKKIVKTKVKIQLGGFLVV